MLWGASASLGKAAFSGAVAARAHGNAQLDPLILAQARTTISLLILTPFLFLSYGRSGLALSGMDVLRCIGMGVIGIAGANFFYYYAIARTSVATAIIVQYTAPIWVLLYMVVRRQQRATPQRMSAVALAFLGSALAIGGLGFTGHWPFVYSLGLKLNAAGITAALAAAFSFAFYNVYGSSLVSKHDHWKVIFYSLLGVTLFWMVINPPWKIIAAHYSSAQWLFMVVFAITSMLLPFSFYFAGLKYLDATRAIVTSCLEPVFAILLAAMFVGEVVDGMQVVGIAVVLAGTILVQLPDRELAHA